MECWHSKSCDVYWNATPWTACSARCTEVGTQIRHPMCWRANQRVEADVCHSGGKTQPIAARKCHHDYNRACSYNWDVGPWSRCPNGCGVYKAVRSAVCQTEDGERLPDLFCQHSIKPVIERPCMSRAT